MCRFIYFRRKFLFTFFPGSYAPFELRNLTKIEFAIKQFVSATPLKLLNRTLWNFIVDKDIPSTCVYSQKNKKTDLFIEWQRSSSG